MNVIDISGLSLADVPRRLRMLADELEQGATPKTCVVVIEHDEEPLDIRGFGYGGDQARALGLLTLAVATMTDSILRRGREPRLPGDAA